MTVYLYCEGVTDYAVIPILMKKASAMPDMDIQRIQRDTLKKFKLHPKGDIKISGNYKFIKAMAGFALQKNIKHIAYHQDADGKYSEVYSAIISGFQQLERNDLHYLAIVPKEMIESWLLTDENAYPSIPNNPKLPSKPEDIWGQKKDVYSNHPHHYFVRVLSQFKLSDNRDTYTQIAKNTDIETLKRRCPLSFGQFYADIQSFISPPSPA